MTVRVGLEVLLAGQLGRMQGARVGLVTNHSGVDRRLRRGLDLLLAAGVRVTALFGPEHGVGGAAAAGEPVAHGRDPATGIPVFSLYGETVRPAPEMLAEVDMLIIDLQDSGSRYYTYPYTMAHCMEAAGQAGIPVLVLDRPNPIGGEAIEGPLLDPAFASFVGRYPIPVRHGLTPGELARLFAGEFGAGCDLAVVPAAGWRRAMWWDETGLPFVPMSPNTTGPDMCILYPGTCLFEGTNLSEGRGTTRPFEQLGAPWVRAGAVVAELDRRRLPGVAFRPVEFLPLASKHRGVPCRGVRVHVVDRRAVRPVALGVHLLDAFRRLHPDQFAWLPPQPPGGRPFIDLLYGSDRLRRTLDAPGDPAELVAGWAAGEAAFRQARAPYLLYE